MEEKVAYLEKQIKRQQKSIRVLFVIAILLEIAFISKGYHYTKVLGLVVDKLEIVYKQGAEINHLVGDLID